MGITGPAQRLSAFNKEVESIEAMFAAKQIGPQMRRELLEKARDRCGVTSLAARTPPPAKGKLVAMNDNQINQQKNPSRPRKRGPLPA